MKSFGIIYKATNKINGKVYVGQTIEGLKIRIKKHYAGMNYYSKFNRHFSHALRKYKKSDFIWEVLEYCNSKEEMDEMEFHYIMQYDSYNNGYNMTLGGEGVIGHRHSKESRKKMSNAAKGRPSPMKGYKFSEESRKRMSESAKKRVSSPLTKEHCRKISEAKLGHTVSKSVRSKISKSLKGRFTGKDNPNSKKYILTTPDGDDIVVWGLNQVCKKYNLSRGNVNMCVSGKRKHTKGFKCRYAEEVSI